MGSGRRLFLFCFWISFNSATDINDIQDILTEPASSSQYTFLFFSIYGSVTALIIISLLVLSLLCRRLDIHCNVGYKITGYFNHLIERLFEIIGILIAQCPYVCGSAVLIMTLTFSFGIFFIEFETNIFDLWTPTDSPIFSEREFIKKYWSQKDYGLNILTAIPKDKNTQNIVTESNLNEWLRFHIDFRLNMPKKTYSWNDGNDSVQFGYFGDFLYEPIIDGNESMQINNYQFSEVIPLCRQQITNYKESQFIFPCFVQHLFDCFAEGNILFPYEHYLSKVQIEIDTLSQNPFINKPSYKSLTNEQIISILLDDENECTLSGQNNFKIPKNQIMGGSFDQRQISSLQTYAYLDSPFNIDKKFKIARGECNKTKDFQIQCAEPTSKEIDEANDFLREWLSDYINFMLSAIDKHENDDSKALSIRFWTPRTAEDLLNDASRGDIFLLILAFVLMIGFASLSAVKLCPSNMFHQRAETSIAGTILVVLAVTSAIGFTAFINLKISPATIQVLPFIALGFGVDDMFIILFSFRFNKELSTSDNIKETMRIAGSSVAATTVANFFGFYVGTFVSLKDVQIFSYCGMIAEIINFIVIIFGFTSILTLTARRTKNKFKDCSFCCCFNEQICKVSDEQYTTQKALADRPPFTDPLYTMLSRTPVRLFCTILFFVLIVIGLYGSTLIKTGLPLADLMPEDTYAQEYLTVREEYYHSYTVALYTDANENKLSPIDWKNEFEEWIFDMIGANDSFLSIGDVQMNEFWPNEMKQFLMNEYEKNHGQMVLNELSFEEMVKNLSNEQVRIGEYKAFECEPFRKMYCAKSQYVDHPLFAYNGVSYKCLRMNENKLSDLCKLYLDSLIPREEEFSGIAQQIYVQNLMDDDDKINGLYVTNYANKLNIFYNLNTSYLLYQSQIDQRWMIFDEDFNLLFLSNSTTQSIPPSAIDGWHKVYNTTSDDYGIKKDEIQTITTSHFNDTYYQNDIVRDLNGTFIKYDVSDLNSAAMSHRFDADAQNNVKSFYKYELMQMALEISSVFTNIKVSIVNQSDIECSAVFSATEACKSITNRKNLNPLFEPLDCTKVSANDPNAQETTFWIGGCDNERFTVSAINEATEWSGSSTPQWTFDSDTSCNCANPSLWNSNAQNKAFNFFNLPTTKTQALKQDFGGFVNDNSQQCNAQSQTIDFECDNLDNCQTLAACFDDALEIMVETGCGGTIGTSDSSKITDWIKRENNELYNASAELMAFIGTGATTQFATCLISYYNDIRTQCCRDAVDAVLIRGLKSNERQLINAEILNFYGPCNMLAFHFNDGVTSQNPCNLLDICTKSECESTGNEFGVFVEGCFDSFDVDCFDDINFHCDGLSELALFNCLNSTDSNLLFPCCNAMISNANFSTLITPNCISPGNGLSLCTPQNEYSQIANAFSMDCADDAALHCLDVFAVNECKQTLLQSDNVSPNCLSTLSLCEFERDSVGEWQTTQFGEYATSQCSEGSMGQRRRYCNESRLGWNEQIDSSQCVSFQCEQGFDEIGGRFWNASYPNSLQRYFGVDVPETWKNLYNGSCDESLYTFELRRRCKLINSTFVQWTVPNIYCRSEWFDDEQNIQIYDDSQCDLSASSIIYGMELTETSDVSECVSFCANDLANCIAFEYAPSFYPNASVSAFCLFYSDCLIVSNLYSVPMSVYVSPFSKTASIENYCNEQQNGDDEMMPFNEEGIPSPNCFNASLWAYFTEDGIINQDKILFNDQSLLYDAVNGFKTLSIVSSYNSFIVNNIDDDDVAVDFLLKLRDFIQGRLDNVIPGGLLIDLFSQYIGVRQELFVNLFYVCICVAVSGVVFLLNWWSVFVVILCNAAMIVEVYGVAHWFGLRVNAIFVLNIIIAIGLTMEFTAHVGRAFVLTHVTQSDKEQNKHCNDAQIRMKKTFREMFTPVSLGAFTTLLGVIPISFARFPYFRQYYFLLYLIIVACGWLNGMIFQPILLSWLPPTPFVVKEEEEKDVTHLIELGAKSPTESQSPRDNKPYSQSIDYTNHEQSKRDTKFNSRKTV